MKTRYKIEERSGIVAIYDTMHPEYKETNGCHSDYSWCIASWTGNFNKEKGHWEMEEWKIKKAEELLHKLNGGENA